MQASIGLNIFYAAAAGEPGGPNDLLLAADGTNRGLHRYDGITGTDLSNSPKNTGNLGWEDTAWDGTNIYAASNAQNNHYKYIGYSESVSSTFAAVAANQLRGQTLKADLDLISADTNADKIYVHDGFSTTIDLSFAAPGTRPTGLGFDGTNLLSTDEDADEFYLHSGISGTITTTISASTADSLPTGIGWHSSNLHTCGRSGNKVYIHSGFSTTVSSSFASGTTTGLQGVAFTSDPE